MLGKVVSLCYAMLCIEYDVGKTRDKNKASSE